MLNDNYTPMRVGEIEIYAVDYSTLDTLEPDETIVSAEWTTPDGLDKIGDASIVGLRVSQQLEAVTAGWYYPTCAAVTSLGNRIVLPDPGKGALQVVP